MVGKSTGADFRLTGELVEAAMRTFGYVVRSVSLKLIAVIGCVLLVSACSQPAPAPGFRTVRVDVTATPQPAEPAATLTPAFTPTATAPAAEVLDTLRDIRLSAPDPQPGAPCGVVDILDFPLDAPDGLTARGGGDFGVYRNRYNGNHAGEDWRFGRDSSFGRPVTAIGHGMVIYAQPLGWGVDKGVLIMRHNFPDGSTILSFYGHLDPPSVVLSPGDCVARNEQVGRIGKPRGSPHLHFEIRSHLPDTPGPGYWPVDPRRAGWLQPSQYIWDYRVKNSPGVMWTRFFTTTNSAGLGYLQDGTFVVLDDQQLVGLDELDGSLRWVQPFETRLSNTVVDDNGGLVYAVTRSGVVSAFEPPAPEGGNVTASSPQSLASRWQLTLNEALFPELIPLPGGGVVVYSANRMLGLSAGGEVLWQFDSATAPIDWAVVGDGVVMTTRDNPPLVRTANVSGLLGWGARIGGHITVAGDQIFVYDVDGIYRLRPESLSAELLYKLPRAYPGPGDIVALPDGGILFAHGNLQDQRLLALDSDGQLRWQRSIARLPTSLLRVLMVGEYPYAVMYDGDVYAIDAVDGALTHIFDAGSRNPFAGTPWAVASGDQILIDFRGGNIVALDPQRALEAVSGATAAR